MFVPDLELFLLAASRLRSLGNGLEGRFMNIDKQCSIIYYVKQGDVGVGGGVGNSVEG